MRPLSFWPSCRLMSVRLSLSAALVSFGMVAAPDVSARAGGVSGAMGGQVGVGRPGLSVRPAGFVARRPGSALGRQPGFGAHHLGPGRNPGGRFGYGLVDRDRFGRDGGGRYGFGRYGYGYGFLGSSPALVGGYGQPRVLFGAEPGLPAAVGIAPSPVLPPAIYVIAQARQGVRSSKGLSRENR